MQDSPDDHGRVGVPTRAGTLPAADRPGDDMVRRAETTSIRRLALVCAWSVTLGQLGFTAAITVGLVEPLWPAVVRAVVFVVLVGGSQLVAWVDWPGRVGLRAAAAVYQGYVVAVLLLMVVAAIRPSPPAELVTAGAALLAAVAVVGVGAWPWLGAAVAAAIPSIEFVRGEISGGAAVVVLMAYAVIFATVRTARAILIESIVEQARQAHRAELRARLLEVVAEGNRLVTAGTMTGVLEAVVDLAAAVEGWDMVDLFRVETPDTLRLVASSGQQIGRQHPARPTRDPGPVVQRVVAEGRTVVFEGVPAAHDGPGEDHDGTALATPIRADHTIAGVLVVRMRTPRELESGEVGALELLAANAGRALELASRDTLQRRTIEELRRVDELKDDFLSTVSHEIRTPVTVILGGAETLTARWEQLDDRARHRLVGTVVDSARALEDVITTLLDFAQLEAGELTPNVETVAVHALATRVIERLAPLMADQDVGVAVNPNLHVRADLRLLDRVLENLLGNAAKYAGPGARVRVMAQPDEGGVLVGVVDDGVGIDPVDVARLGERFYRSGDVLTRDTRGVGIGLAFVRHVLALHGSQLRIESRLGHGATFSFVLPAAGGNVTTRS